MKKLVFLLVCFSFTFTVFAADSLKTQKASTYENIEKNLLVGLATDNEGLKFSCAYFLGEIKSSKAVIPLLRLFHNGESDEMKIIAALSLCKINSERGVFAVKRGITFADSKRVQRLCNIFYNQHLRDERKGEVEVEEIQKLAELTFNGYQLSDFN
ncbi:MAG: hypothetical protein OQJ81_08200 [Melioribacteraceae bacterium]|nr:hypothetical protein [Melioribacteraceae bacterium]